MVTPVGSVWFDLQPWPSKVLPVLPVASECAVDLLGSERHSPNPWPVSKSYLDVFRVAIGRQRCPVEPPSLGF